MWGRGTVAAAWPEVLWGCGGRDELEKSGADVLTRDTDELYRYITEGKI